MNLTLFPQGAISVLNHFIEEQDEHKSESQYLSSSEGGGKVH